MFRDFDAFDLRKRLPEVIAILHRAIERNKGITYIHCTAGLGRAPAVAVCIYTIINFSFCLRQDMAENIGTC